jgi:hypothetical protein
MNEEWMTEIDGACRTSCQLNLAISCGGVTIGRELPERRTRVTIGQQLSRNGGMRTFPYLRRRIIRADIRKQEEHE